MNIIDFNRMDPSRIHSDPYQWGLLDSVIPTTTALELSRNFPTSGFYETSRAHGSDKTYQILQRPMLEVGQTELYDENTLHPLWRKLFFELRSPEYQKSLEKVCGKNLDQHFVEIVFNRYSPGCWLSPHTDSEHKTVTHLFYFNEDWNLDWGGVLQVFSENDLQQPTHSVLPHVGNSVVLVRSNNSWHAVNSVRDGIDIGRLSLQVIYWNKIPPPARAGRQTRNLT